MLNTIGYEGATLSDFIDTLKHADVQILVDIRERAQSRKKGFSKSTLSAALTEVGITYLHFRELGDPKEGRDAARSGNWPLFLAVFGEVLETAAAQKALDEITELASKQTICLLCYERDVRYCHRKIVSDRIAERLKTKARHLGVNRIDRKAA